MIGIAVPCYKYHIPVLKRFLDSVETQTRKPDFVVVSCSSSTQEDIPKDYTYSFPFQIIVTQTRLNAAQNRNLAADQLIKLGCSYISFFDCDDVMHPQRIEAILEAFHRYPESKIVLHSFWGLEPELEEEFEEYSDFIIIPNTIIKDPIGHGVVSKISSHRIHHSQITVSKDIFEQVRFRQDKKYERGEDSEFCADIIKMSVNTGYICNPLSKYFPEGKWY